MKDYLIGAFGALVMIVVTAPFVYAVIAGAIIASLTFNSTFAGMAFLVWLLLSLMYIAGKIIQEEKK